MQIAQRFGAKVSLALSGRGMFLIVVKDPARLDNLVKSVGGSIVARFNANRALVVMTLPSYLGLRASIEVSFIGPVNVDQQRLAAVLGAYQAPSLVL
ncbi:hypothetical protein [Undibacterium sp. Ren11W]|uniref:hypothetical protein n=1 Tax=Undibacterium sp. Ren11W TaxID=3413045 RepID=UPI003BF1513E